MKQLIKRILIESVKEKLQKRLEEDGLVETLNTLGLEIDEFSQMVNIPVKELVQKYNLFEEFFTDEEFKESLTDTVLWMWSRKNTFEERLKRDSVEEVVEFLISMTIDDFNSKLTDFNTGDWKIPNTPKLLYLRYGDWLINSKPFKTFYTPYIK